MQCIKYFLAICDEGNFTRAASRCGVAQPSVSIGIKKLETELGRALFHRAPCVTLTELGKSVEPHFRQIIRSADQVCREAAQAFFIDAAAVPVTANRASAVNHRFVDRRNSPRLAACSDA
jgi:DNA-binding transcriptional LysR family regulator